MGLRPWCARRQPESGARLVVTLIMATVLTATACTSRQLPPEPTPPATSPTPTQPTPIETTAEEPAALPETPVEMQRDDDIGAAAAAGYFLDLFPYVMGTGDTARWDEISAQDCGFCSSVRDDVQAVFASGGRFTGGALTHEPGNVLGRNDMLGGYTVEISYTVEEGTELDAAGTVIDALPEEKATVYVDTVYSSNGWTLVEVSLERGAAVYVP